MAVADFVGGALGGAVVSSIIAPLIAQRRERRDVRAELLRHIAEVERTRWAPGDYDEFRTAVVSLRAAALVAGASRELSDRYLFLAEVGRRASDRSFNRDPDVEGAGGIPRALADLVALGSKELVNHIWRPYRTRLLPRRALKRLDDERTQVDGDGTRYDWRPSRLPG